MTDVTGLEWKNGTSHGVENTPLSAENLNRLNTGTAQAINTLIDEIEIDLDHKDYIKHYGEVQGVSTAVSSVICGANNIIAGGKDLIVGENLNVTKNINVGENLNVTKNINVASGKKVVVDNIEANNANNAISGNVSNAVAAITAAEAGKISNITTHTGINVGNSYTPTYFLNGLPVTTEGAILLQDSCDNMNKIGTLLSSHSSDKFLSLTLSFTGDVPAYQYAQTMGDSSATVDTSFVIFKANIPYTFYFAFLNTAIDFYYFTEGGSTLGFRAGSSSSTDPVKATFNRTESTAITNPSNKLRFFYTGANFITSGSYTMGTTVDRPGTFILTYTK